MQVSMLPSQSGAFQQILLNTGGQGGVGAILKAKHFRIHAVTDQTILFNWALIYAPGRNRCPPNSPPERTRKSRNRSSL